MHSMGMTGDCPGLQAVGYHWDSISADCVAGCCVGVRMQAPNLKQEDSRMTAITSSLKCHGDSTPQRASRGTHRLAILKAESSHILCCLVRVSSVQPGSIFSHHHQLLGSTVIYKVVVLEVAAIGQRANLLTVTSVLPVRTMR